MCEQNKDLQGEWKPKLFDKYYGNLNKKVFTISELSFINHIEEYLECYIYLPTQEQLQGMVVSKFKDFREMHYQFSVWLGELNLHEYFKRFDSMAGLWLAFVMSKKYNKIWDGKDWKKINGISKSKTI